MTAALWGFAAAGAAWFIGACAVAVVIGKSIRAADDRCCPHSDLDDELRGL